MALLKTRAWAGPLLLLAAAHAPAAAANWVEVGVATNGVRALVNTETIVAAAGRVRVEQRFILPAGATGRIASVDQHVIYGCKTGTVQTLKSTEYDSAGRVLRIGGAQQNPVYTVMSGTLPRYILDVLC